MISETWSIYWTGGCEREGTGVYPLSLVESTLTINLKRMSALPDVAVPPKNHLSEMNLINSTSILKRKRFLDFIRIIRSLRYFIYKALSIQWLLLIAIIAVQ